MKKSKDKATGIKLNPDEQALLESVERDEWESVKNLDSEMALAKTTAENTLRKDARVNIRISNADLTRLKQKAVYN